MAAVEIKEGVKYFDIPELIKDMGVTKWAVRRWIKLGKLKAHRVGRKYYISAEDLRQFIEASPTRRAKESSA